MISADQAKAVFGRTPTEQQLADLNTCLKEFEINTPIRVCHFIAQCAHESGGLKWMKEIASGDAYEGSRELGNIKPGDGRRYKGAGILQMTGRYNYQKFADYIGDQSVMLGCDYVAEKYPFSSAGFWWKNNKMNEYIDNGADCIQVSAAVNGRNPANGLEERKAYFKKALEVFRPSSNQQPSKAMPYKLTAKVDTFLKKRPVQAEELRLSEIVEVPPDMIYFVERIIDPTASGSHKLVVISHGAGSWYIYAPHWKIEQIQTAKEPKPASGAYKTLVRALNISQPDARTCQSACIAMAIGNSDVQEIRRRLDGIARSSGSSAGSPHVMGELLKSKLGDRYKFDDNASLSEVREWLRNGEFLITHGWFTPSGHVICLDGVNIDETKLSYKFDVKDPWSEFNAPLWRYTSNSNFYDGYYSSYCIYAACVASVSASDAARIYNRKELDSQRKGAWIHRIMP